MAGLAAFYAFAAIENPDAVFRDLKALAERSHLRGTVIIAREGVNGTLAGSPEALTLFLEAVAGAVRPRPLRVRRSELPEVPFRRLKIRVKPEIVTLGVPVDPTRLVGTYVRPEHWNAVLDDPSITLIDTRNGFEVALGSFPGAIDPHTTSFGEFPDFVETTLDPERHPRIAMFCTGGIRCEKASSLLLQRGFAEVLHLEGGILGYLDRVPPAERRWIGDCFVFDDSGRVSGEADTGS